MIVFQLLSCRRPTRQTTFSAWLLTYTLCGWRSYQFRLIYGVNHVSHYIELLLCVNLFLTLFCPSALWAVVRPEHVYIIAISKPIATTFLLVEPVEDLAQLVNETGARDTLIFPLCQIYRLLLDLTNMLPEALRAILSGFLFSGGIGIPKKRSSFWCKITHRLF